MLIPFPLVKHTQCSRVQEFAAKGEVKSRNYAASAVFPLLELKDIPSRNFER